MSAVDGIRAALRRIRRDYWGVDRRAEYTSLVRFAIEADYRILPLADFHAKANAAGGSDPHPLIALRHDVDIRDPAGNEAFWAIERRAGIRSTFYFRRSTAAAHAQLIALLLRDGFEVGYHFEEGASLAKRLRARHVDEVRARRAEIEDAFRYNCADFRRRWNPGLVSVAGHGDWINRQLAFSNNEFVSRELLADCGLSFEAYGDDLLGAAAVYVSDVASPPARWAAGYGLADAIRDRRDPLYVLMHERNWFPSRRAIANADLCRLADGICYRLGR